MLANNGAASAAYDLGLHCLHMFHKPDKTQGLYGLTHCIRETPKRAFYKQWRPRWNAAFYGKKLQYNLTPLYIYNGLSQVYCITPEGILH